MRGRGKGKENKGNRGQGEKVRYLKVASMIEPTPPFLKFPSAAFAPLRKRKKVEAMEKKMNEKREI